MGHKGRRNNNNRKPNQNKQDNNQKANNNYPKASEQQLQIQCLELYELLTNKTKILKQQKLDYCYIISTKWLEDWKQYVGFHNIQQDDQKKHKKIGKKHPGKVNYQLVKQNKNFYPVPMEEYSYLNTVINQKKQKDDDFIAIAKQIWDIFASKYDHVEIKRPKRVLKKGTVIYDDVMLQLQVVIADYTDKQLIEKIQNSKHMPKGDLDDQFPCDKLQLSTLWEVSDLCDFVADYCLNVYEQSNFKIWKIQGYATVGQVQRALWDGVNKKLTKIQVPCSQLTAEKYGNLDLDEFLKDYYSLVIQVGKSRIQKAQVPDPLEGYCQECIKKKILNFSCACGEVFYCSDQCRIVDQVWHQKVCKIAFQSQDDEQFNKKSFSFQKQGYPTCGLTNLGNTCYMNSVLQSLVSVSDLTTYFTTNKYQKQIDQKQYQENQGRLLSKYSKFLKQLVNTKQSFSPWSLKGQINYFLPPFKGFKQHDANDFLVNFINTLNEQLKKQQGKIYHRIFEDDLLGEFNSLIRCPDCGIEISNDEIFSQITLPIKQRAKTQTTNYVIYQNPRKITRGKCLIQNSWEEMRKAVGVKGSCLLMAAREGQHAVDVDEDQIVQKTVKKLKRQLIFYPNCNYQDNDELFSFIPITEKYLYNQRMKSPYGYPAVINIDPQLHTLGSFYVEALKQFCPPEIYQEAIKIKQKYFKEIQQTVSKIQLKKSTEQSSLTQISQNNDSKINQKENQKENQLTKQICQNSNKQLTELLKKYKVSVFIVDLKRNRNICAFCKRKCDGCSLPIQFDKEVKEYLQGKQKQVVFQILLEQKIQQEKIQKDTVKSGQTTLHDCMELFTEPEQLDEENAWWCSSCENLRLAYKQLTIKKMPKILIIHLNRFKADGQKKVKNSQPIEYQQLQQFYGQKYQLLSVIIHEGSTQGGHYWSICRRNDKYYIFNDSKVNVTQKICNKNAYILIYKQIQ